MIEKYVQVLKERALNNELNYLGAETVLGILYECYNENRPFDHGEIKDDFNELYRQMNGMSLREMDKIIYPVCKPCGDHEKGGFVEGVKIGIKLLKELDI